MLVKAKSRWALRRKRNVTKPAACLCRNNHHGQAEVRACCHRGPATSCLAAVCFEATRRTLSIVPGVPLSVFDAALGVRTIGLEDETSFFIHVGPHSTKDIRVGLERMVSPSISYIHTSNRDRERLAWTHLPSTEERVQSPAFTPLPLAFTKSLQSAGVHVSQPGWCFLLRDVWHPQPGHGRRRERSRRRRRRQLGGLLVVPGAFRGLLALALSRGRLRKKK